MKNTDNKKLLIGIALFWLMLGLVLLMAYKAREQHKEVKCIQRPYSLNLGQRATLYEATGMDLTANCLEETVPANLIAAGW